MQISRREFAGMALLASTAARDLAAASGLDETVRATPTRNQIPAAVAAVASADNVIYTGAFGKCDPAAGGDLSMGSVFHIHSMTKPVTTVAAMQVVEQGKLNLDEPNSKHVPALSQLNILQGFDQAGKPILQPARKPVLLRHLLTHTSGFAYDSWDQNILRYEQSRAANPAAATGPTPLMFEPGTRWEYETYFRHNILDPLQMPDTVFNLMYSNI